MLSILNKIHEPGPFSPSIKDVRKWAGVLNELVFDGKIPKFRDIIIKQKRGQFASVTDRVNKKDPEKYECILTISETFLNFEVFIAILAHEMIHCYQSVVQRIKMNHGPSFFVWKEKLAEHSIILSRKYSRDFVV